MNSRTGRAAASGLYIITILCLIGVYAPRIARGTDITTLPPIVTAGADHSIKEWDATGRLAGVIGTHDDSVNAILIVPESNGETLLSVGDDKALKTWDIANITMPALTRSVEAHSKAVLALAATPDGRIIATGGADHRIRLWLRSNGARVADVEAHSDAVRALQFTSNGKILVSAGADRQLRTWRVTMSGKIPTGLEYQSNIPAHDDAITGLSIAPGDRMIATVSTDGFLKTWSMGGAQQLRVKAADRGLLCVAVSPDGNLIATGDLAGRVRLWKAASGAPFVGFTAQMDKGVNALIWTPDSKTVIGAGGDRTVRFWNAANGKLIGRITAHDSAVKSIALLP